MKGNLKTKIIKIPFLYKLLWLLISGYIIKSLLILIFFQYSLVENSCSTEDLFIGVYYLLLYTSFLIPFYDFPIASLIGFLKSKGNPAQRIVFGIGYGIMGSVIVFIITLIIVFSVALLVRTFGSPLACGMGGGSL